MSRQYHTSATIDGVEVSGLVWLDGGTWGDRWTPPEAPTVERAQLTDDDGAAVEVDLDGAAVQDAILDGIDWGGE